MSLSPPNDFALCELVQSEFERMFGRAPESILRVPGRINLIGEHVDYQGGTVLPVAIGLYLMASVARLDVAEVRVWSGEWAGENRNPSVIDLDVLLARKGKDSWLNYIIGVLSGLKAKGISIPGFEMVLVSTLPAGAGLSSSAALETITALAVEALTGESLDVVERALICQQAEHQFAGVPCGIMDQLAVAACRAGHALRIDCRDLSMEWIPLPEEYALVVAATGVKHALVDGEYQKRREECAEACVRLEVLSLRDVSFSDLESVRAQRLGERLRKRAYHVVSEVMRVSAFCEALKRRNVEEISQIMRSGHQSLRDDFEVSCPELDALVEAAYRFGPPHTMPGSRMTGGGFGGSTVSLVHVDRVADFKSHMEAAYRHEFGRCPQVFATRAAAGAEILSVYRGTTFSSKRTP